MILDIKKNTLDGKKIGYIQTKMLSILANNYCNSCEELARFVYNDEPNRYVRQCMCNVFRKLRKRGLCIERISTNGFRLIDEIYIDY